LLDCTEGQCGTCVDNQTGITLPISTSPFSSIPPTSTLPAASLDFINKALPSIAFLRVLPHCHLHHLAADSAAVPNLTLTILAQIVLMPHQSTCQNWNVAVAVAAAQIASVDVVHLVGGAVQIQAFRPSLTQLLVSLQDILMKVIHAVIVATQLMFPLCPSEVAAKAKIRSRSSMARYFFTSLSPICFSFLYYLSLCLLSHLVVLLFVG